MKYLLVVFLFVFAVACNAQTQQPAVNPTPESEQTLEVINAYRFSQSTNTVLTFERNSDLGELRLDQDVTGTSDSQRRLEEVQIETYFLGVSNAPEVLYYQDGTSGYSRQAQGNWRAATYNRDLLALATEYAERSGFVNNVARPQLSAEELLTIVFVPQSRQTLSLSDVSRVDVSSSDVAIMRNAQGRITQITIDASLYYRDEVDNLLVDITHETTFSDHNVQVTVQRPAGLP